MDNKQMFLLNVFVFQFPGPHFNSLLSVTQLRDMSSQDSVFRSVSPICTIQDNSWAYRFDSCLSAYSDTSSADESIF